MGMVLRLLMKPRWLKFLTKHEPPGKDIRKAAGPDRRKIRKRRPASLKAPGRPVAQTFANEIRFSARPDPARQSADRPATAAPPPGTARHGSPAHCGRASGWR